VRQVRAGLAVVKQGKVEHHRFTNKKIKVVAGRSEASEQVTRNRLEVWALQEQGYQTKLGTFDFKIHQGRLLAPSCLAVAQNLASRMQKVGERLPIVWLCAAGPERLRPTLFFASTSCCLSWFFVAIKHSSSR